MNSLWQIILVFLLSTFKMILGGIPLAAGFNFGFIEMFVVVSTGGITGVFIFVYLSDKLWHFWNRFKKHPTDKKVFTKSKRRFIRIKNRFGLPGIVFLAPAIISLPIGCFLAIRFFHNKHKVTFWMIVSVLGWGLASSWAVTLGRNVLARLW